MADFLAFRPNETDFDKWIGDGNTHAGTKCTSVFGDMVRSNKVGWIQRMSTGESRIAQADIGHTHEGWPVNLDYIIKGKDEHHAQR